MGNPSCLQTTRASLSSQKSSHTVPQVLLKHISTRPSSSVPPPTNLTSVLLQTTLTNQYIRTPFQSFLLVMKILLGPQSTSSVPPTQSHTPSQTRDSGIQVLNEFILPSGQVISPSSQSAQEDKFCQLLHRALFQMHPCDCKPYSRKTM